MIGKIYNLKMRAIILLAILGSALAVPKNGQKIVGGVGTTVQKYPFMSNLQYLHWGLFWSQACGGALLTSSSVLTAANCVHGDFPSEWRVRLGTTYASSGGSVHDVFAIVLHPQYNDNTLTNDVAIVRLSVPAHFSELIQPARIAGTAYLLPDNIDVVSLGWGSLSHGGHFPEQLQEVTVQTINHQICSNRYAHLAAQPGMGYIPPVTADMLCSGILDVGGKDTCEGDSGGPLVHDSNVVIGIVSWGHECADPVYPRVNARVSYLSDWISANGAS